MNTVEIKQESHKELNRTGHFTIFKNSKEVKIKSKNSFERGWKALKLQAIFIVVAALALLPFYQILGGLIGYLGTISIFIVFALRASSSCFQITCSIPTETLRVSQIDLLNEKHEYISFTELVDITPGNDIKSRGQSASPYGIDVHYRKDGEENVVELRTHHRINKKALKALCTFINSYISDARHKSIA